MQAFIPSVLSALRALLKGPRWLLKVISILFSLKRSRRPPPGSHQPTNLPYDSGGNHLQSSPGVHHPTPPQSPDHQASLQSHQPHCQIAAPSHAPVIYPANAQNEKLVHPETLGTLPTELVSYLHDTDRSTFEAQISPPDSPQSQHDPTQYKDKNQANKHNEHYMGLRAKAKQEGDEMGECFQQSHDAYEHAPPQSPDCQAPPQPRQPITVRSHTPEIQPVDTQQPPRSTITGTPLVVDLHEDHTSLRSEAKHERNGTREHFQPIENLVSAFECTEPPLPATTIAPSALYSIESTPQVTPHAPVFQPANTLQPPSHAIARELTIQHEDHTPRRQRRVRRERRERRERPIHERRARRERNRTRNRLQQSDNLVSSDAPVVEDTEQSQRPVITRVPLVIDPNEDPASLRTKAKDERQKMRKCLQRSERARARNKQELARKLALDSEAHMDNMVRLNREASEKIFQENNKECTFDTIDLHGQYVSEAESYFTKKVEEVRDHGQALYVIVGKGKHSKDNIPKIKLKIQALGEILEVTIEVDPENDGRLVVTF